MSTDLIKFRHNLHRTAEVSGSERETAGIIREFLKRNPPDTLVEDIGGYGLAAVYRGAAIGPVVLLRCELDALPIHESSPSDYCSTNPHASHKCGHDGHMAILAGLATLYHEKRPAQGSVVLLYQPSEETGEGARRVLDDPKFDSIRPDFVFALHNLPGYPLDQIVVREGVFASASQGLIIELEGATSHAAEPNQGRSPALAVAALVNALSAVPQQFTALHEAAQVTIIHVRVGEVAFGTSPGTATVMATLRSHSQAVMNTLHERCIALTHSIAAAWDLKVWVKDAEPFPPTVNDPGSVSLIHDAANHLGLSVAVPQQPFPWSEDFGHYLADYPGAMFGIGAGEETPALHHPLYDFLDSLIITGVRLLARIAQTAASDIRN